jgi:hypothetical protein
MEQEGVSGKVTTSLYSFLAEMNKSLQVSQQQSEARLAVAQRDSEARLAAAQRDMEARLAAAQVLC